MGETSNANLLTTGSIPKKIIMFAIPLLWGNLFQQLYNVADSLIVGNFLGNNALAAHDIKLPHSAYLPTEDHCFSTAGLLTRLHPTFLRLPVFTVTSWRNSSVLQ